MFRTSTLTAAIIAVCLSSPGLTSVHGDYPLIHMTVESRDPLYSQQQQDVESWYSGREETPPLTIYRYEPLPTEDLFSVAAAFNLPYESLATLNGWDAPGLFSPADEVLVPNIPGLFVPEEPLRQWEKHLSEARNTEIASKVHITASGGSRKDYLFFPGEKFSSEERIRFLGSLFSAPLRRNRITSPFGYRPHPFSGRLSFHPGVDLMADIGTPVMAARDGRISDEGKLEIYGSFIIIDHDGGYQTVYAHLDEILVEIGQEVEAGRTIAHSGNSGISTGPHLHFEVRRDGKPTNPSGLTSFAD